MQQVFRRERDVLKSALYSQLETLDTSDAVIHLNQLERRLSEQVRTVLLLHFDSVGKLLVNGSI